MRENEITPQFLYLVYELGALVAVTGDSPPSADWVPSSSVDADLLEANILIVITLIKENMTVDQLNYVLNLYCAQTFAQYFESATFERGLDLLILCLRSGGTDIMYKRVMKSSIH